MAEQLVFMIASQGIVCQGKKPQAIGLGATSLQGFSVAMGRVEGVGKGYNGLPLPFLIEPLQPFNMRMSGVQLNGANLNRLYEFLGIVMITDSGI